MDEFIKKKYSGKKVLVHEEFLIDIKAHNRKLVEDKNKLINDLTKAENKILELQEKLNGDVNINTESINHVSSDNENIEQHIEENIEPIIEYEEPIRNANNFQEFKKEYVYTRTLTDAEKDIICYLMQGTHSYMDLKGRTSINERALAVHVSRLRKLYKINIQKIKKHKINFYYIKPNDSSLINYNRELEEHKILYNEKFLLKRT